MSERVMIHVCDEGRGITRDFSCEKTVLIGEMRYFSEYLQDTGAADDIDISVHCDVEVFDWLIRYVGWRHGVFSSSRETDSVQPVLDMSNIISILISAEFLQMAPLVSECTLFIVDHIADVVRLPIDLSCISETVVSRMSKMIAEETLDKLVDKKDKLLSRLYSYKLEGLFAPTGTDSDDLAFMLIDEDGRIQYSTALERCVQCGTVYADCGASGSGGGGSSSSSRCPKAKPIINFRGEVVAEHIPDSGFDINTYIVALRARGVGWKHVFYHIWGLTHSFVCDSCGKFFNLVDWGNCSFHPQPVHSDGFYPCCGARASAFDGSGELTSGCCTRKHSCVPRRDRVGQQVADIQTRIMAKLAEHENMVCIPQRDDVMIPDMVRQIRQVMRAFASQLPNSSVSSSAAGAGGASGAGASSSGSKSAKNQQFSSSSSQRDLELHEIAINRYNSMGSQHGNHGSSGNHNSGSNSSLSRKPPHMARSTSSLASRRNLYSSSRNIDENGVSDDDGGDDEDTNSSFEGTDESGSSDIEYGDSSIYPTQLANSLSGNHQHNHNHHHHHHSAASGSIASGPVSYGMTSFPKPVDKFGTAGSGANGAHALLGKQIMSKKRISMVDAQKSEDMMRMRDLTDVLAGLRSSGFSSAGAGGLFLSRSGKGKKSTSFKDTLMDPMMMPKARRNKVSMKRASSARASSARTSNTNAAIARASGLFSRPMTAALPRPRPPP